MKQIKILPKTTTTLVAAGALNWGLVAMGFNLVEWLMNLIRLGNFINVVYIAVGISGAIALYNMFIAK